MVQAKSSTCWFRRDVSKQFLWSGGREVQARRIWDFPINESSVALT